MDCGLWIVIALPGSSTKSPLPFTNSHHRAPRIAKVATATPMIPSSATAGHSPSGGRPDAKKQNPAEPDAERMKIRRTPVDRMFVDQQRA